MMKPESINAGAGRRLLLLSLPVLLFYLVLILELPFAGLLLAATTGQPTANPESNDILPVILEAPPGCPVVFPHAMNNGSFPDNLAIVGAINCDEGTFPVSWRQGAWLRHEQPPVLVSEGEWGGATSVSDGPMEQAVVTFVVGDLAGDTFKAWVSTAGQPPIRLAAHNNEMQGTSALVSSDGKHIVETSDDGAAQWTRTADGWSLTGEIASGLTAALTADGSMIVGNVERGAPWVWTATPSGGGLVSLTGRATAHDISHDGSIIVGARPKQYEVEYFPEPVYWLREGQEWRLRVLQLPDSLTVDEPAWAVAVAVVDGQPVIVGNIRSSQRAIDRAVAWIPGADGEYGLPVDLLSVSGSATARTEVVDINRSGTALGWSREPHDPANHATVVWQVVEQPRDSINVGHAGAWYNAETTGQGLMIDVEPVSHSIFLAWFTFTDSAADTPGEQHWYTAQGHFTESDAYLPLYETLGGQLNGSQETVTNPVGRVGLSFSDCHRGELSYEIDADGRDGTVPLQRLLPGSGAVCERMRAAVPGTEAVDINDGMDGAWIDGNAPGQGFLFDAHANPDGSNFIFVAWLTFGDGTGSGQRWLTAQGNFSGATAELPVHETSAGRFDDTRVVETRAAGAMRIDFSDCSNAQLSYSLDDGRDAGEMAISRLVPGGQALCEELSAPD